MNYQQNRPRLAGTPEQESLRDVKVASGAVAGALTTLLVDHVQARNEIRRAQRDGYAGGESEPGALPEPVPVPR